MCAPTIGERRAKELDTAIAAHVALGGTALFVTATVAHERLSELEDLLELVQRAWTRTWRFKKRPDWYGGQARAIEVTWGKVNGWHPHVHAVILVEPGHDVTAVEDQVEAMRADWARHVEAAGGKTRVTLVRDRLTGELVRPGWHVRRVTEAGATASYLTKVEGGWSAGFELGRLDLKTAKGGFNPPQLLDAAVRGDRWAAVLYATYEKATMGKRRIVTSPGLLKRLGVEEVSDEEAAARALESDPVVVVSIPGSTWDAMLASGWAVKLLDDVEDLAVGESDGWPWPADWLVRSP